MSCKITPLFKDGKIYLPIEQSVGELFGIEEKDDLYVHTDGESLIINHDPKWRRKTFTPLEKKEEVIEAAPVLETKTDKYQEELAHYWNMAATEGMREKFMGSLRPMLRAQLDYDYSETICEKEAMKLCVKYYKAREKGITLEGPHLPDWSSVMAQVGKNAP